MFRFAHPEYLYFLLLIPIFIGVYIFISIKKKKEFLLLGEMDMIRRLMPMSSPNRQRFKFYATLLGLIFIILVLARPQFGSKMETVKRQGVELIIALDVSNSMMAEDISPNRLEKAKQIVSKLIDEMDNDKVGLIVFAGDAYTQISITSDYVSAKMFMPSIKPSLVPVQGTAIGTAIDMAMHSFGPVGKEKVGRSILVITDGENHEDDAVEAAKVAAKESITVNVIGMGTGGGAPIPIEGTMSFRKDKSGNVVVSKLNEEMCKTIALAGNGIYVRADNTNNAQRAISKELRAIHQGEVESKIYSEYDEQFQLFAGFLLVLLTIEIFILERKNKWFNKIKLFE